MTLSEVLDHAVEHGEGDQASLGDLLRPFGGRAYGPLLLIPAIIAIAPTGAIPGMSIATGAVIFLLAAQMVAGRASPWLPRRLLDVHFSRDALERSVDTVKPRVRSVERLLQPRLTFIVSDPLDRLIGIVCIVMAATMWPLALVPFAVFVPGLAVALLALALTARDGLCAFIGLALAVGALWLVISQIIA